MSGAVAASQNSNVTQFSNVYGNGTVAVSARVGLNFIDGTQKDGAVVAANGARLPVAAAQAANDGRALVYGIRPEHLTLSRDRGTLSGTVSHVEKLGGETLVYVRTDPHGLLTVRLFGEHDYSVDEPVHLTPDDSRTFHFDAAGQRLR